MRPDDIALIRTPGGLTLSPDGAFVAFVVTQIEGDGYRSAIHVAPTDGSRSERLLTAGPRDTAPCWSPDGAHIAFLRAEGDGPHQLWVMNADGSGARRLTTHEFGVCGPVTARHSRSTSAPVWSPNARRIAYTARIRDPSAIGVGRSRRITRLRYRIDELGYVNDRPSQIFVLGLDDQKPTLLSDGVHDHWDASWSPDGGSIIAATARHETRDLDDVNDIVLLGLDGTSRLLTRRSTTVNLPTFAPDGTGVYFVGIGDLTAAPNDARARNVGLWRVGLDGGASSRITDIETIDLDDGRTRPLIFWNAQPLCCSLCRGSTWLGAVDATGELRPMIEGKRQVIDYAAAGDVIVAAVTTETSAGEIIALKASEEQTLTSLGASLSSVPLFPMTEIAAIAPDGYPVHGWFLEPPTKGPHPLLLFVHGGPDVQAGYSLFDEAQVYVEAGYAVIMSNPRGSAGYGEAHARSIRGRLGTDDADDLIALLKTVMAQRRIDPGRVGIIGGSYGGFMTAWLAAHHGSLFRAAIVERGVFAWDSMMGTSDLAWSATSMVGTDRDEWRKQSPLAYADRISIPMLIIHWEGDLRAPFEQAQQMFSALRARKHPVEFVVFPGGNHNASRNGSKSDRLARFKTILDWFQRHLT